MTRRRSARCRTTSVTVLIYQTSNLWQTVASKRRRPATYQLAGRQDRGLASHGGGDDPARPRPEQSVTPAGSLVHIPVKSRGPGRGRLQHDADTPRDRTLQSWEY